MSNLIMFYLECSQASALCVNDGFGLLSKHKARTQAHNKLWTKISLSPFLFTGLLAEGSKGWELGSPIQK